MKNKALITVFLIGVIAIFYMIQQGMSRSQTVRQVINETGIAKMESKADAVRKYPDKNLLSKEKSPYLLQHANNPVHWYPWGDDAFAKAKAEDKPVFLSIGYSTCHWCHVMEHE